MRAMKSVGSCLSIKEKVFHLGRVNSEVQLLGFQCEANEWNGQPFC